MGTITISVAAHINTPPTANAGADQTISAPANTATLVGSGTDTDGTIVSYLWEQVSGPIVSITSPTSATTGLTGIATDTVYVFRLTVTDNNGATGTDNVSLTRQALTVYGFKWIADPATQVCEQSYAPDVTGVLTLDVIDSSGGGNYYAYIDTPGVASDTNQQIVYTGHNFLPVSVPVPQCYALASDPMTFSGAAGFRFEFNVAKLLTFYPSINSFVFKIAGRAPSSRNVTIRWDNHGANEGGLTMTGSPGTYVPSNDSTTNIGSVTEGSIAVPAGANGTYAFGTGNVIRTYTYNRIAKTITTS